jgi:DNA-binding NarL/FixJ family response regulator
LGGYDLREAQTSSALQARVDDSAGGFETEERSIKASEVENGRVAILESQRFFRECILRGMSSALPLSFQGFSSLRALEAHEHSSSFRLVILCWTGSERPAREENLAALRRLRNALPGGVVIVLASGQDAEMGRLAIADGARGYVPMSMGFEIAIEAVRFVLRGGTFVPPEILLGARAAAQKSSMPKTAVTSREILVIRAIQQGKPNKVIAYELDMCESTVKIHVRHVMKKLGAKNRTDLAIKAWDVLKDLE